MNRDIFASSIGAFLLITHLASAGGQTPAPPTITTPGACKVAAESTECQAAAAGVSLGQSLGAAVGSSSTQASESLSVSPSALAEKYGFKYLRHMTNCANVAKILASGMMQSSKKTGTSMVGIRSDTKVFLQLVDGTPPKEREVEGRCFLLFDLKLLNGNQKYHVSEGWPFGLIQKNLMQSTPDDLVHYERVIKHISQIKDKKNEVVFADDVPINQLVKIFLPRNPTHTEEDQKLLKTVREAAQAASIPTANYATSIKVKRR